MEISEADALISEASRYLKPEELNYSVVLIILASMRIKVSSAERAILISLIRLQ